MGKLAKATPVQIDGVTVGTIRLRFNTYQFRYRRNSKRVDVTLSGCHDQKKALELAEQEYLRDPAPAVAAAPSPIVLPKARTLSDVLKLYKQDYEKRRRESSARRAFEIVEKFIQYVGETKSPASVERAHVKAFRDMRQTLPSKTTKRKLSPWTINNDLGRVRHFLRWAAREGFRPAAPDLTELKLTCDGKSARGLSQVEVEAVRAKIEGSALLSDWFELAINAGFRPDEQAHLRACDYEERLQKVHVRPWGGWKPKTAKGKRSLPVNAAAAEILKRRQEQALAEMGRRKLAGQPEGDGLLFPSLAGTLFNLDNLRHQFHGAPHSVLPEESYFTLYALRHTYAYREVAAGTPINKLMLRMGHTDPKTTKGYFEGMDLDDIGAPPVLEPRKAAQG
jgi:integrase